MDFTKFLEDDDSLLEAESLLVMNTPNFELIDDTEEFFNHRAEESDIKTDRFPEYTEQDIEDLKTKAVNHNTTRSTKTWMNVLNTWCSARNVTESIETLPAEKLDALLCKFYAEVKMKNGDDYEPESLKIMQAAIDRFLKERNYSWSITRAREFNNSQQVLNAKAISLRQEGKGKRPNKSKPLTSTEEEKLWELGQLGSHSGKALTNTMFKILTEQMGLRGRQEHHDAYVEDFTITSHVDGSESIEFSENPTKTRSGGLRIPRRKTPQVMWSTDGGERDPVALFKLWLSKRPDGMKDNGPLYLSIINRPKSNVWYTKIRMGANTIGKIIKSITVCLGTDKKLTNHSMRKTLVQKLKKSGQPRHKIKEITGHARESSLDDYDEVDEEERKEISHVISGFAGKKSASSSTCTVSNPAQLQKLHTEDTSTATSCTDIHVPQTRPPLNPLIPANYPPLVHPALAYPQPNYSFQAAPLPTLPFFLPPTGCQSVPGNHYSNCTINMYNNENERPVKKRRRAVIFDSDEDE